MAALILDGKAASEEILAAIAERAGKLKRERGIVPGLAAILVGDDSASQLYVGMKRRAAEQCGFYGIVKEMPASSSTEEVIAAIKAFNADERIHGILVQLPLPKQVDKRRVLESIAPEKDADGLTGASLGAIAARWPGGFVPATARGVMELLKRAGVSLRGKNACVIGEGVQTGRPIALLMLNEMATVTVCNEFTQELKEKTLQADVLVSCVGKPGLVSAEMVKPGAVVVDVGISKLNGETVGDVDFDAVAQKASFITPVPGGVGPTTVAMLLQNTLEAAGMLR